MVWDLETILASINISIPELMRDWIQSRVESGRYATASDYVRELILRDQSLTADHEQWLTSLDASIERALADAEAGRVKDAAQVLDRLHAKYAALAEARERR